MNAVAVPDGFDAVPVPRGRLILTAKRHVAADPARIAADFGDGSVVVCLNPERELAQWPDYVEWLRVDDPGRSIWFSMPDWSAPGIDEARVLLDMIVDRLDAGRTVVVHCSHGIGRTGTVAAGVLMIMGCTREEALDVVARHRAGAGPQAGSQSSLLAALEQQLADDPARVGR